jgi:hypothetical protein
MQYCAPLQYASSIFLCLSDRRQVKLEERNLQVTDHDGPDTINVHSDEPFIRSLDRVGFVSLPPEP